MFAARCFLPCASLADQLTSCMSQMQILIAAIQPCINTITHLSLDIEDEHQHWTLSSPLPTLLVDSKGVAHPGSAARRIHAHTLTDMANSVLAKLAPALPRLTQMSLIQGSQDSKISERTLLAFRSILPKLRKIEVQTSYFSPSAFNTIRACLANLTHFVLITQKSDVPAQPPLRIMQQPSEDKAKTSVAPPAQISACFRVSWTPAQHARMLLIEAKLPYKAHHMLQVYVTTVFKAVGNCSRLRRIDLYTAERCQILIDWDILPQSLQELRCNHCIYMQHAGCQESQYKLRPL